MDVHRIFLTKPYQAVEMNENREKQFLHFLISTPLHRRFRLPRVARREFVFEINRLVSKKSSFHSFSLGIQNLSKSDRSSIERIWKIYRTSTDILPRFYRSMKGLKPSYPPNHPSRMVLRPERGKTEGARWSEVVTDCLSPPCPMPYPGPRRFPRAFMGSPRFL